MQATLVHQVFSKTSAAHITMKLTVAFFLAILALVRSQGFGGFGFGSPYSFGGGLDAPVQATRDPRANTGPVVFPPAPPDNGETSGVVVGASGYGFVPPNQGIRPQQYQSFF